EPLRFDREHVDHVGKGRRRLAPKPGHRESNRGEGILELMRDLTRRLAKRAQSFGLEGTLTSHLDLMSHPTHLQSQHRKLRRSLSWRPVRQGLPKRHALCPANELVNGTAE